jgi:hypothetical protein
LKKAVLLAVLYSLLLPGISYAQNQGAPLPFEPLQFFNSTGQIASNAKLCSFAAGTTTPQSLYTDAALTTPAANPLTLTATGTTSTNLYTASQNYKFILYANLTGAPLTCPYTGAVIWSRDQQYDHSQLMLSLNNTWTGLNTFTGGLIVTGGATTTVFFNSINNRQFCTVGTDFPSKFTNAAANVASTGGIVDCSNLNGTQTLGSDVFSSVTTAMTVVWPIGTVTDSVSFTAPATMTMQFLEGGILSVAAAHTATISDMSGSTLSQHFAGSGQVFIGGPNPTVYPQWFPGANAGVKIIAAIAALPTTGGIIDARGLEGSQTISNDMFIGVTKPVTLLLGAATFAMSSVQTINVPSISVIGLGFQSTQFTFSGTGDAFRIQMVPFTIALAGTFSGFSLIGNSNANAVGMHIGDTAGTELHELYIANFTGTNSAGMWFDNRTNWTERSLILNVSLDNNTQGILFDVNGSAYNSFGYNRILSLGLNANDGQQAIRSKSTAVVYGGTFIATANLSGTGALFDVAGTSIWDNELFSVNSESTAGSPVGLTIGTGGSLDYVGVLRLPNGAVNTIGGILHSYVASDGVSNGAVLLPFEVPQPYPFRAGNGGGTVLPSVTASGFLGGVGFNFYHDGTNWRTRGDGTHTAGMGILSSDGDGAYRFISINSTGGADQTISNAGLIPTYQAAVLDSSGLFTPNRLTTALGVLNAGGGLKHTRPTTGIINASTRATITVTWPGSAFAGTSYTTECTMEDTAIAGPGLRVERITSKAAGSMTVQVINDDTMNTHQGNLACVAMYDQ